MCAHQHKVAEVACYRLGSPMVGCAEPPSKGRVHPTNVFEFTKNKVCVGCVVPGSCTDYSLAWMNQPTHTTVVCFGRQVEATCAHARTHAHALTLTLTPTLTLTLTLMPTLALTLTPMRVLAVATTIAVAFGMVDGAGEPPPPPTPWWPH